jgi:PPP family 3-phenylpropionic acid transporter
MLGGLLFLHLANMEVPESVMGLSLAFIMIGELPVLFYSDLLLRRLGARGLLLASIAAGAAMLLAVSWMRAGWVVLLIQLLHGLAFTGKLTAILYYVSMTAPKGMQATAQTLFSALSAGLGAAVGGVAGGALFDAVGSSATFRLFGLTTLFAGIVFAFITRGRAAPVSE